jgi:hypothetical protein
VRPAGFSLASRRRDRAPGNIPHNPVRFADTVGIVVERVRPADSTGASAACDAASALPAHVMLYALRPLAVVLSRACAQRTDNHPPGGFPCHGPRHAARAAHPAVDGRRRPAPVRQVRRRRAGEVTLFFGCASVDLCDDSVISRCTTYVLHICQNCLPPLRAIISWDGGKLGSWEAFVQERRLAHAFALLFHVINS